MSFKLHLDPKDEASTALVAQTGEKLQQALMRKKKKGKFTQQQLADKLELDRSRVNRCFSGYSNLTLTTLAELAWAMGMKANVDFLDIEEVQPSVNYPVQSASGSNTVTRKSGKAFETYSTKAKNTYGSLPSSSAGVQLWTK